MLIYRIEYSYNCDGYLESNIIYDKKKRVLRLFLEYKYDEKLDLKTYQAKVLVQALYYKYRNLFNEDKPEYFINTWDAGLHQIKKKDVQAFGFVHLFTF